MVKKTHVKAYSAEGVLVDEIEYYHPIDKGALRIFLRLHYTLHPGGYISSTNYKIHNPLELAIVQYKSLF